MLAREDPKKRREWWNRWYHNNKAKKIAWQARRRLVLKKWIDDLKAEHGCARCPEKDPACLQFHHKDPRKKKFNVANAASGSWSEKTILKEIRKCIVVCANCHLKEHRDRRLGVAKG